jgi:hypothetical protein
MQASLRAPIVLLMLRFRINANIGRLLDRGPP